MIEYSEGLLSWIPNQVEDDECTAIWCLRRNLVYGLIRGLFIKTKLLLCVY